MATKKSVKKAVKKATSVVRSDEYKAFLQLMSDYEVKNPERFERNRERLEAKLKTL